MYYSFKLHAGKATSLHNPSVFFAARTTDATTALALQDNKVKAEGRKASGVKTEWVEDSIYK